MYMQRAAIVWVGALMGFLACSPGPSAGTSSTSTGTSSATTGGGTGGMDAGTCAPRENYYNICGFCLRCVEEKCCQELIACETEPGCIDCAANGPDAQASLCGSDAEYLLVGCSGECEWCHSSIPDPGCVDDAGADGG